MFERLVATSAVAFALIVARLAGFIVSSPFPGANVGKTQRVGLVMALALVVTAYAPTGSAPSSLDVDLVPAALRELGCGLVLGIGFRFVFMAAEVAGQLLSQAVGLSSASMLNPTIEAQDVILARIVTLLGMLLALDVGAHRVALGYLLGSFRALPVGTPFSLSPTAPIFLELTVRSFTTGVQLAMPVIAVAVVVHLALAMIARAAPALQIFSVGFAVILTTGSLVVLASLRDVAAGLIQHFGTVGRWLDVALGAMAP
jgi:flagellar biosynthesis protein FliR